MSHPEKTFDPKLTALCQKIELPSLSEEVLKKHRLVYYSDQKPMQPVFFDTSQIWATAVTKETPVYAVFDRGTADLVILEKTPQTEWTEIKLEQVENLYGLVWKMTLNMPKIELPLSATPE